MNLKRKTELGTLIASYKPDKIDYPGFYVDLWRKGKPMQPLCNVEYDPTKRCVQVVVYGNGKSDEPTNVIEISLDD